ncbi:MAG TPA: DUF4400 domain-containing protein [Candidatus Eremiobacteraceae bacterium]|nr:DUF4400 domain-containing protein [Candidatus Eremiobacteraceae bacterium]
MASRSATFHGGYSGAFWAPFRYLLNLTLLLSGLLLAAWAIDGFLVFKIWPDGLHSLEVAIATTAAALDDPYGISSLRAQGVAWANGLYHALFVASAIDQIITADPHLLTPFDQSVQRVFVSMLPALQVAMLATKLYGLRLALWLSATLPVALSYAVGMIDGLAERSIRRYSGGRESATLYHRAKYAIACVAGLSLFVYVCIPAAVELQGWSWVTAAVIGVLSRLQWKYYKKYV